MGFRAWPGSHQLEEPGAAQGSPSGLEGQRLLLPTQQEWGEGVVGREARGVRRRTWAIRKSGNKQRVPARWGRARFDPGPGMGSTNSGKMSRFPRPPQPTWGGHSESLSLAQVDGARARWHPEAPHPRGRITGWPFAQMFPPLRVQFLKKDSAPHSRECSQPSPP